MRVCELGVDAVETVRAVTRQLFGSSVSAPNEASLEPLGSAAKQKLLVHFNLKADDVAVLGSTQRPAVRVH